MAQVWRASRPGGPLPIAMFAWWAAWVAYWFAAIPLNVLEFTRFQRAAAADAADPYADAAFWLTVIGSVALFASVIFVMLFLPTLVREQDEKIQAAAFD